MTAIAAAVLVLAGALVPGGSAAAGCGAFLRPVPGPVIRPFAPTGTYSGHWGIDLEAEPGTAVRAAAAGTVTFAGIVAGTLSVTVHHGGGLRTSYSFLSSVSVAPGPISRGSVVGRAGIDHGGGSLHLSLRIHDRYIDPAFAFECRTQVPAPGLRLLPAGTARSQPS